jgi:hypothetical protein
LTFSSLKVTICFHHCQPQIIPHLLSVFIDWPVLDISHKCNCVHVLWDLVLDLRIMMQHVIVIHFILHLSIFHSMDITTFYLSIYQSINIFFGSTICLLWIRLLWSFACKSLHRHIVILLSIYLVVGLMNNMAKC